MMYPRRKWMVSRDKAELIRRKLIEHGGREERPKLNELWRIRYSDGLFILYKTGTLYSPEFKNPSVKKIQIMIDEIAGTLFVKPDKEVLIGFDEAGKGEALGPVVITGVMIPSELFGELQEIVMFAGTKKKRSFEALKDDVYKIRMLSKRGLRYKVQKIPPWMIDRYNLNRIMDNEYERMLRKFTREVEPSKARIVFDEYGIGDPLKSYLRLLKNDGVRVIRDYQADEKYLEVKVASILAKWERESVIKRIQADPDYRINGRSIGSGNLADNRTVAWLREWRRSGRELPWFVKRSFLRKIDPGIVLEPKIEGPIVDTKLLPDDFLMMFGSGKPSIEKLAVKCPYCWELNKSIFIDIVEEDGKKKVVGKCIECGKIVPNLGYTLRYYTGYLMPDTRILAREDLCREVLISEFFYGFTILINPIAEYQAKKSEKVRKGIETLWKYGRTMGIKIRAIKSDVSRSEIERMSESEQNKMIIEWAKKNNAIVITVKDEEWYTLPDDLIREGLFHLWTVRKRRVSF